MDRTQRLHNKTITNGFNRWNIDGNNNHHSFPTVETVGYWIKLRKLCAFAVKKT
ncbi:MAG: hypothetical protein H7Y10_15975 [Flavobacterium sp.]|nr:hypothetical protein [Flavobacterium sp.]